MRREVNSTSRARAGTLLNWYSYLMAFPTIIILQNLSVFIFPFLLKNLSSLNFPIFSIRKFIQIIACFFCMGAIVSVWRIPEGYSADSLSNALAVLPNYIYWSVLLIFMVNIRKFLFYDIGRLYRMIFWGVISSCLYYFIFFRFLDSFFVFKRLTQNAFGFLLICFSPISVYYCVKRYGLFWGIAFAFLLVLLGFLSGSRSASVLVFIGSCGALLADKAKRRNFAFFCLLLGLCYLIVFYVPLTRTLVKNLNSRTFDLIYRSDETFATDRSYLVRVAMIEKALEIYKKYPATGIGLNNFTSFDVKFRSDFAGADYVIHKEGINETSAHNSYAGLLAEGGLVLLIPFLTILCYCFISFIRTMDRMPSSMKPTFIGLICMSVHLYFIMAIVNVFAWYLISLACAFSVVANRGEYRPFK